MATKPVTTAEVQPATQADDGSTQYLGGKKVRHRFNWKPTKDSQASLTKVAVFDFSRCTEQQLLELALDSAVIKVQSHLRAAALAAPGMKVAPNLFETVDVLQDVILAKSAKADPRSAMLVSMRRAGSSEKIIAAALAEFDEKTKAAQR